jgi:hypothetical protein
MPRGPALEQGNDRDRSSAVRVEREREAAGRREAGGERAGAGKTGEGDEDGGGSLGCCSGPGRVWLIMERERERRQKSCKSRVQKSLLALSLSPLSHVYSFLFYLWELHPHSLSLLIFQAPD